MTKRLGQALDLLFLLAAPALLAWGIVKTMRGDIGLGIFAIFVGCALPVGVGASVLRTWTGYQPGRHYLLGAVFVLGGMAGFSIDAAIRADDPIVTAVGAVAAAILLPFALLALYGWIKGPPILQTGRDGDARGGHRT